MEDIEAFNLDDPKLLFSDEVLADPRPLYDQLRREAPVWRIPDQDSYLVSDPTLIREAVGRPSEFSSNLVSLLHRDNDTGCPVAFAMSPLGDPIHVLATADPPVHAAHRKLLQSHLSPAAVGELEKPIRRYSDERLEPLLAVGAGDVVAGLTNPLPAQAICHLVGLPARDADRLVELVWDIGLLLDGVTDHDGMSTAAIAALELAEYSQSALRRPMENDGGLLAVLIESVDTGLITADEALGMLMQLITAGTETTSSLMATSIETLARDQDLQEHLRREPDQIPVALEEILRSNGPFQFHYRYARVDTTLGSTHIPAQSRVLLMWAAANRPDSHHPAAVTEGSTDSRAAPHYAFGRGLHFCIGAPLARLEARVVLERMLQHTSQFTLNREQAPARRPSISLRRHVSLPVVFTRN